MCRAAYEGGRRCQGRTHWHVNREGHARFTPDVDQERHWRKPAPLLSMTKGAIRLRRHRASAYAAEVEAVRTIHGVGANAPIGPVLREELWEARYRGAGLTLLTLASRFRAVAAEEGVPVEVVADRHRQQTVRPNRQRAGQRLADLVVADDRPDWVDPERLVRTVEPPNNGTPGPAYLRVVTDLDGREWILVTSFDGSEPMVWPHTAAGLKAGAWECLERVRAVNEDPAAYDRWLAESEAAEGAVLPPYRQQMDDGDFLAHSDGMHLV